MKTISFARLSVNKNGNGKELIENIVDYDDEIVYLSKEIFSYREDNLDFKYKYAISAIDFYSIDDKYEENSWNIELHMIVAPESLHKNTKEKIEDYMFEECDYLGILNYGLGIKLSEENYSGEDIDTRIYEVAEFIPVIDTLKGFYLDKSVNKIGSTGWDMINEAVLGKPFIDAALERYKGE